MTGADVVVTVLAGVVGAGAGAWVRRMVDVHGPGRNAPAQTDQSAAGRHSPVHTRTRSRALLGSARTFAYMAVTSLACAGTTLLVLLAGDGPAPLSARVAVLLALLAFAVVSVALAVIDVRTHRLPDAIVLPAAVLAGVLLSAASAGLALFAALFLVRLVQPHAMGGGDVKLAGLIGLHLGWFGVDAVLVALVAAFVLGGLYGAVLLVAGRADRRTAIAFGPWLLAGAWVGIVLGALSGPPA